VGINFNTQEWYDRESQNPTRRKLTKDGTSDSEYYIVERADDATDTPGTPFNASSMNNLESRIASITIDDATPTDSGLMSTSDKEKLGAIETQATRNVITSGTAAPSGGNNGDIYLRFA
jgi:hypothetical protein